MALPDFRNNLLSTRDHLMRHGAGPFTTPEWTVDAAFSALNIANLKGQDAGEVQRRAALIRRSKAYKTAGEKIAEQLRSW